MPPQQPIPETLAALGAYAAVCRHHRIKATVSSIDDASIAAVYNAAAARFPSLLAEHISALSANAFAHELVAAARSAQAMAAIDGLFPARDA